MPASCDDVYPDGRRDALAAELGPLNDPGITMYSTQVVPALEVIEGGAPTLRCTWGPRASRRSHG